MSDGNSLADKMDVLIDLQRKAIGKDIEDGKRGRAKPLKKFKLPLLLRLQEKRLAKMKKMLVIYPMSNRNLVFKVGQVRDDGMLVVEGKPRDISDDYIYLYKGRVPCVILPDWAITPVGTHQFYKDLKENAERSVHTQTTIIKNIERAEIDKGEKKKLNPRVLLYGLVVVGIIIYVITRLM